MQNSKNRPDFPTSNAHSEHFAAFSNTRLFSRLSEKFTPKPYFKQYATLRTVVLIASYLFNVLSAATAAILVFFFLASMIREPISAGILTAVALVALELTKRETNTRFWNDLLQFSKFSAGLMAAVFLLSAVSVASSYFGAKRAVHKFSAPAPVVSPDSLTAPLRAQLGAIDEQIKEARATKWKGTTTTRSQRTIERLTRQRETLTAELARVSERVDNRNDVTEQAHAQTVQLNAKHFALFTLICEVLFILAAFYLEYYDYRSFAEYCAKPAGRQPGHIGFAVPEPASISSNGNGQPHSEASARRPIGFYGNSMRSRARDNAMGYKGAEVSAEVVEVDKSLKPCAECGVLFRARTTWHKYCSEQCKLTYHEKKRGAKFDPQKYRKKRPRKRKIAMQPG